MLISSCVIVFPQVTGSRGCVPEGLRVTQQAGRVVQCIATPPKLPSTSIARGRKITTAVYTHLMLMLEYFEGSSNVDRM